MADKVESLDSRETRASMALGRSDAKSLNEITFTSAGGPAAFLLQKHGNIKDIQAHLRHVQASTTLRLYMQIPESFQMPSIRSINSSSG
ncbi:MAG: hypothetical protein ACJ74Z_00565 [Bryobacteraceae bacterium]